MTTPAPGTANNSTHNNFGTMAVVCFAYSVFALLLLHLLRRDYVPRDHMVSDYGVGPYSWVMNSCFLGLAGGFLALFLGLLRHGPRSVVGRIGTFLLIIPAIGVVVSAIFPVDLLGAPDTPTGEIHNISFFVNVVVIMLSSVLVSFSFGSDSRWSSYRRTALVLASFIVVAFVIQFRTLHRGMPYGYANRLFLIALFGWFFCTASRLRSVTRDSARG